MGFIEQMCAWEMLAWKLADAHDRREISPKDDELGRVRGLEGFWSRFVSSSVQCDFRSKSYAKPYDYDPSKQTVVATQEITPSVAEVETHDTLRDYRFIYVLVKEAGVWKIQRKFRVDEYDYRDKEPI
ncbi:MAG: hypothetical protein R3C01_18125 [Planctomycetaceae bacterium]